MTMELWFEAIVGVAKLTCLVLLTMWLIPKLIEKGATWEL